MENLTLLQLNGMVRQLLSEQMPQGCWVQAELSEVNANASGHCYLELVQSDDSTRRVVARAHAVVWRNVYSLLRPYFEQETGIAFAPGIKVLLQVNATFHELYGYTLVVNDINPAFTVGEMARNRMEIMRRLQQEGVADLNRELPWPRLPQRVAVISSATAAGYGDFCNQLTGNAAGYRFAVQLFPAVMQGRETERSVIEALNAIAAQCDSWDVVVVIRGGGSTADLSAFDTYELAANCAQFPLPIITGIGHERDNTLLDMVAHRRVKTPTAAAALLIESLDAEAALLARLSDALAAAARRRLADEKSRLGTLARQLPLLASAALQCRRHHLALARQQLPLLLRTRLAGELHRLDIAQERLRSSDPQLILRRGYSLTLKDGRPLRTLHGLSPGDTIVTRLVQGEIESVIKKTDNENEEKNDL